MVVITVRDLPRLGVDVPDRLWPGGRLVRWGRRSGPPRQAGSRPPDLALIEDCPSGHGCQTFRSAFVEDDCPCPGSPSYYTDKNGGDESSQPTPALFPTASLAPANRMDGSQPDRIDEGGGVGATRPGSRAQ